MMEESEIPPVPKLKGVQHSLPEYYFKRLYSRKSSFVKHQFDRCAALLQFRDEKVKCRTVSRLKGTGFLVDAADNE